MSDEISILRGRRLDFDKRCQGRGSRHRFTDWIDAEDGESQKRNCIHCRLVIYKIMTTYPEDPSRG